MTSRRSTWPITVFVPCVILLVFTLPVGKAFAAESSVLANSTPSFVTQAQNLGPEDGSNLITVTLWLHQQNEPALDELARQMYTEGSPNYHRFLTYEQYRATFAPTAQEAAAVSEFLKSHNLSITEVDKDNHYVSARGRIADVQTAFNVAINRFQFQGKTYRSNTADAAIEGPTRTLVKAVTGLNNLTFEPHHRAPIYPETRKPYPPVPLASGGSNGLLFAGNCFLNHPQTVKFTTGGGFPIAVYSGNRYGTNPGTPPPNLAPCGYDAAEMQTAYGLHALYRVGWSGQGQTVVIVDAFGSPTIQADAATFSLLNKLPAPDLIVYTPNGRPAYDAGWATETTIDVEWSHSVAPMASTALVATGDNSFTLLNAGVLFAIENGLGNVISNSYGIAEAALIGDSMDVLVTASLNEVAAVLGISTNYSTGDSGDNLAASGFIAAGFPATNIFATGVGGVSVFLNPDRSIKFQTGWGNNIAEVANVSPNPPVIPSNEGNIGGGGGGPSIFWPKPSYQSKLPGKFRQTPDVSWVADPFTGVEIIITPDGKPGHPQAVEVWGGTSVACPMFSGLWAIANQAAGTKAPLGNAAPYMYKLSSTAIDDVKAVTSPTNVSGHIYFPPGPPAYESADALSAPLDGTTRFVSALYHSPFSTRWFVLTFGTDTSLKTGNGWDNVTGVGTPIGLSFVQEVVK